jgi:hypothetical protein
VQPSATGAVEQVPWLLRIANSKTSEFFSFYRVTLETTMLIRTTQSTQGIKAMLWACLCLISMSASAQVDSAELETEDPQTVAEETPVDRQSLTPLQQDEDDLIKIAPFVISSTSDSAKRASAENLQSKLLEVLANPASFDYEFANLRMTTVAIASHPKANVKLFTFNIILKNGVFNQYGVIQRKTKSGITLFSLFDTAQNLPKDYLETTVEQPDWIGGLYYQLIPHKIKRKQYYVVMAFDGHNINSNRSIIDVLSFENDLPIWGAPIFRDGIEDPSEEMRVVFEYHKSSRILMRYEEEQKTIVFDEVGPPFPAAKGNVYYYIPTGDYSGYKPSRKGIFTKEALDVTDFGQGIPNPTIFR